jgi:SAM-dependent methyltransferase
MKTKKLKKRDFGVISLFFLMILNTAGIQQKKPEVPYVPTPENVVAEMLKMADVGKDDVVYDLGCGDGRIVITAARELGCRGVGIDIDPRRIKESKKNATEAGVTGKVQFFLMDLFEADLSPASVVTLYLLSEVNLRLRPKLFRELAPGTRVVSHDFDMNSWKPDDSVVIDDEDPNIYEFEDYWSRHNVYFWIIPANVTGTWEWSMPSISGNTKFKLTLDQMFQEVKGEALEGSTPIQVFIKNGKITGTKLEFSLERKIKNDIEKMHFAGEARGHTMEGSVTIEGKPDFKAKWKAKRIPSTFKSIDK